MMPKAKVNSYRMNQSFFNIIPIIHQKFVWIFSVCLFFCFNIIVFNFIAHNFSLFYLIFYFYFCRHSKVHQEWCRSNYSNSFTIMFLNLLTRGSRFMPFCQVITVKGMQITPSGVWNWLTDSIHFSVNLSAAHTSSLYSFTKEREKEIECKF